MDEKEKRRAALARMNNRIDARFKATEEELEALLEFDARFQEPELYRSRLRLMAQTPEFRNKPSRDKIIRTLGCAFTRVAYYIETCGAWGSVRQMNPVEEEDERFARLSTRPARYAKEIKAIAREGFDPPILPPDYYDRYIEMRRLKKAGLTLIEKNKWLLGRAYSHAESQPIKTYAISTERDYARIGDF